MELIHLRRACSGGPRQRLACTRAHKRSCIACTCRRRTRRRWAPPQALYRIKGSRRTGGVAAEPVGDWLTSPICLLLALAVCAGFFPVVPFCAVLWRVFFLTDARKDEGRAGGVTFVARLFQSVSARAPAVLSLPFLIVCTALL